MLLNSLKIVKKAVKNPSIFLGGVAFGTVGVKVLASKTAKKGYSNVLAKTYKAKDEFDSMLSSVKQHADDVIADAKDIYEEDKKDNNLKLIEGE